MGEVSHQHLPPQVQDFVHHVPKPVEQIPLVLLQEVDIKQVVKKRETNRLQIIDVQPWKEKGKPEREREKSKRKVLKLIWAN